MPPSPLAATHAAYARRSDGAFHARRAVDGNGYAGRPNCRLFRLCRLGISVIGASPSGAGNPVDFSIIRCEVEQFSRSNF
jgi:hypothetical protein